MTTSRERVETVLTGGVPDRLPLDLGGCPTTGMHVSSVSLLRQALGLDPPGTPVKVVEPYQMLGEIRPDLMKALGVDVVSLSGPRNMFGFANEGWKPWTTFDGTPVLVPEAFNTEPEPNGDILMYAEGDTSSPACARMPEGGFYFDSIMRQEPIDDATLDVEDNLEEFTPISDEDLAHFAREAQRLSTETDQAIMLVLGGTGFGDIALVPAPSLKRPRGIRDVEEWYVSTATRRDHIHEIFERQCEIALGNLPRIYEAVGERPSLAFVSGTDFGMQRGPFISPRAFRDLFKPFYRRVNDWIHEHTSWKTFIHSCGSVRALIPDFIEAGFDVLNPVQTAAASMDPRELKEEFGDAVVFWGGGVDTQRTLPFGTADEVREQVRERIRIFGREGGFVFNTIHNVQPKIPVDNLKALYDTVRDEGRYPLAGA
jgi:hypothetical protein